LPQVAKASIRGFACKYMLPHYPPGFVGAEVHVLRCARGVAHVTATEIP
jgi:hypothetical protein